MTLFLLLLITSGAGDTCVSRLQSTCGTPKATLLECEVCVATHISSVQPCSDQDVTAFCSEIPAPAPSFISLSTELSFLFRMKPQPNVSTPIKQAAVEALATTFYNDTDSFNANTISFSSNRLVMLLTIKLTDLAEACSRLVFVNNLGNSSLVKDKINARISSLDEVETIEVSTTSLLSSTDGSEQQCSKNYAYTGSSEKAKHIVYLVTFGTIGLGTFVFLYILVTESYKLYFRQQGSQERDVLVTYDSSLASSMYKRDSRSAIPDLSGMVKRGSGGKLQLMRTPSFERRMKCKGKDKDVVQASVLNGNEQTV